MAGTRGEGKSAPCKSMTNIKSQEEQEVVPIRQRLYDPRITDGNPLHPKRILLVTPILAFPPESGAYQRTYYLWKALNEIGPVDVVQVCDERESSVPLSGMPTTVNFLGRFLWQSKTHLLDRLCRKSTLLSLTINRLRNIALPKHWDYEVDYRVNRSLSDVLGRNRYFLAVGRYLLPIVKTGVIGRMPCLLDIDDIDFEMLAQKAQDATRPCWRRFLDSTYCSQIKRAFEKWVPQFNGVWVTKAGDTRYAVTRNAAILPNIPYNFPAFAPQPNGSRSAGPIILTVGLLTYEANHNGIDRFIRQGWPKVRRACPTAEYWLAGRNDPAIAEQWQAVPGVRVLGFVDDLAALYNASWFTLCPLWIGAGTNIKVLESLAFGRTCVTTAFGHRGFEDQLYSDDSLLVAANAEDLAENCIRLVHDDAQRLALAKRGREVVQREFSYQKFASIVHREVERALGEQFCK